MGNGLDIIAGKFAEEGGTKAVWLAAWLDGGYAAACRAAGVDLWTPYKWEAADPAFKAARGIAERIAAEGAEDRLRAIADGVETANTVQLNALTTRLRALRPDRYGPGTARVEVTGAGGGAVRIEDGSASRAVELLARFALAARMQGSTGGTAERPHLLAEASDAEET